MEGESVRLRDYVKVFVVDTLPRQIYLHSLFRLPYLYFSRVERIFKDADLTLGEIKEMALQAGAEDIKIFRNNMLRTTTGPFYDTESAAMNLSPAYQKLKTGWENFIDSLMREWQTLNLISVLLLPAIMTMLQIQGVSEDPITRYVAFWSLICALLSLLYCCLFNVRFASMRKVHKAAEWALEVQNSQNTYWNVWVMLAMPVVWLAWSIITFIICIMFLMWRVSVKLPPDHVFLASSSTELGFRIFICFVLGIGIIYGVLIIDMLRRYGTKMDEAWQRRVGNYVANPPLPPPQYNLPSTQSRSRSSTRPSLERNLPSPVVPRRAPIHTPARHFESVQYHRGMPPLAPIFPYPGPPPLAPAKLYLPPPFELNRPRPQSPTERESAPSRLPSSSTSSHERRRGRRTRPSSSRRTSPGHRSYSNTSSRRIRHLSTQKSQSPSPPLIHTRSSVVSEGGQWGSRVPSHDEAVATDPAATAPLHGSSPSQETNIAGTLPPRSSPPQPSLPQPAEPTSEEGGGEFHPPLEDEGHQVTGLPLISPLAGGNVGLSSDRDPYLTSPERRLRDDPHSAYPQLNDEPPE